METRYVIGIDLGTTNSAVSFVDLKSGPRHGSEKKHPPIDLYPIAQVTGPGEVSRLSVLPSFLYLPGPFDVDKKALRLPWSMQRELSHFAGVFARDHGVKVPARLISSAKSWLCHGRVDRNARILPWGTTGDVQKMSPVEVTAAYLSHIRGAWNSAFGDDEEAYLEHQQVILTVPASFDEVARDLTVAAAMAAGYGSVTLLEEPLAAFYAWLMRHESDWDRHVAPGELILVCDVGGGTTDFTLITLRATEGSPRFERIAVGDHLILGGDNMDLALARQVEGRFSGSRQTLSADRWKSLCHQCRQAKERILGDASTEETLTLMGGGSRLVGGTLTARLSREDVLKTVLDGFFPLVSPEERLSGTERKGITEFGLPYEADPAITRHLGGFVNRHREVILEAVGREVVAPDVLLFNGGALKPAIIQERIREAVRHFFNIGESAKPRVLENPDPDLSVALGAAYYGLVKTGIGVRVGSGSARAYYVGVEEEGADPGADAAPRAVCLVERGLDEGQSITLADKTFQVLTNQPVAFPIYGSSFRYGDRCGDIVTVDDTFTALPPIRTVIRFGKKGVQTRLPVQIEADYTEIGTLALYCRSLTTDHRWRLQFQLRDEPEPIPVSESAVLDESVVASAKDALCRAFEKNADIRELDALPRTLSAAVDLPKEGWPLGLIRSLADTLLDLERSRQFGPDYEARWMNLTGFVMRPGMGDGFDTHRLERIWKLYAKGPVHANQPQVRAEWWILWRRVAAGLKSGQQRQIFQDLAPVLVQKKGARGRVAAQENLEMWMALANMERLSAKDKTALGRALVMQLRPKESKPQHFWSLSRIGAREPLYGPLDRVVPPGEVERWIGDLLARTWRNPKPLAAALAQLARKTGDRVRDLSDETAGRVLSWMKENSATPEQTACVTTRIPLKGIEESALFGEALPAGLVWRAEL